MNIPRFPLAPGGLIGCDRPFRFRPVGGAGVGETGGNRKRFPRSMDDVFRSRSFAAYNGILFTENLTSGEAAAFARFPDSDLSPLRVLGVCDRNFRLSSLRTRAAWPPFVPGIFAICGDTSPEFRA